MYTNEQPHSEGSKAPMGIAAPMPASCGLRRDSLSIGSPNCSSTRLIARTHGLGVREIIITFTDCQFNFVIECGVVGSKHSRSMPCQVACSFCCLAPRAFASTATFLFLRHPAAKAQAAAGELALVEGQQRRCGK